MTKGRQRGLCETTCNLSQSVKLLVVMNMALLFCTCICFGWLSWSQLGLHETLPTFTPFGRRKSKTNLRLETSLKPANFVQRSFCSSLVRGPIPTTLPTKKRSNCTWQRFGQRSFSHFAGSTLETTVENAQQECIQLGNSCRGISCRSERCLAMMGHMVTNKRAESWTKTCLESGENLGTILPVASNSTMIDPAVVVLAHNRKNDMAACLDSLLQLPESKLFQVYVSLDDDYAYPEMRQTVVQLSVHYGQEVVVWSAPNRKVDPIVDNEERQKWFMTSTGKIAHHYWTAFERVFMDLQHEVVIFLEEDLIVAPDFFALFRSTHRIFAEDSSIWCVSAWNDAGFAEAVSDQCRLFRTTYFPGLGFMLPRPAWLQLREEWPTAPTMGWDYWMRTAFRRADKECIVPEVPRSRHESRKGSSVITSRQVKFFELFAFADLKSACTVEEDSCNQFGDISYLLKTKYEFWMRAALNQAHSMIGLGQSNLIQSGQQCKSQATDLGIQESPEACALLVGVGHCSQYFSIAPKYKAWGCRCCRGLDEVGKEHARWSIYSAERTGDPGKVYVYPYKSETYSQVATSFGLQPERMQNMIPQDVRAEHYGLVVGKHLTSGAVVLLVDQRSSKEYLPAAQRLTRSLELVPVAGLQGESCEKSCAKGGMACDPEQFHFLNNCEDMINNFGCKFCAHQTGDELPSYVVDDFQPTVGQCLVTFLSPLQCDTKHPSTRRLCPCMPRV